METNQTSNTYEETSQQSQQPSSPFTGKRVTIGLVILIVILVLVLSLTGKNQQTPSTSNTATTAPSQMEEAAPTISTTNEVYTNPQTGIQFSHPSHLMVQNISSDIMSVSSGDQVDPHDAATGMQISIFSGNKVTDQLDLAKDLFNKPTTKDITIGGLAAKEISGNGVGMLEGKFIKFVEIYHGGKTYELSYFEGAPDFTKEMFDQIVTSFKLTK